ncbi:MAG: RluA family pseudouridine synthase [Proteobacteria bacterium]|nr:RluA family pseudouridine synthase [Pseudomonadota bacterium]
MSHYGDGFQFARLAGQVWVKPCKIRTFSLPASVPDRIDPVTIISPTSTPSPGHGVRSVDVPDDRDGQRLDNFLLGQLKGAPRSLIYKLVRSGQVRINGKRAKPDSRLQGGDVVRIPPVSLAEPGQPASAPTGLLDRLAACIVFEDERLLALDKPSGLASHGGSGISFGAIEALRQLRPQQNLELVHRLDRDTSGLLVVAKKRSALTELQALMREDDDRGVPGIRKRYLALLAGRLAGESFTVDAPLDIGLRQGGQRHVRVAPGGKPSISHFHLIERRGGHSYVDVRIETGRTHQIRVHAAHLGHPVAGDDKYGDPAVNQRLKDHAGLKRLFLHAAALEFALDGGRRPYTLHAPLAPELATVLERLG